MKKALFYLPLFFSAFVFAQNPFTRVRENLNNNAFGFCHSVLDSLNSKDYQKDSVLFYKVLVYLKAGKEKDGHDYCDKLAKQYPNFDEVHYLRGLMYFQEENYGKSANEFTRALRTNPGDIKALYNRALALGMMENYLTAIEDLSSCIEKDPNYVAAHYSRAYWYEFTGNYEGALKDYEVVIKLDPKNYDAYFGLAYIHRVQKDTTKACEAINRAINNGSQIAEELKERFCSEPNGKH